MHSMMLASETRWDESRSASWYAVYTKHQHEKSASDLLSRKGFEVFLPLYGAKRRWKDRSKIVSFPLFPCYLFLRINLEHRLDVLRTPGVFWIVENDGRACPIPEFEVEAVRKVTENSPHIEPHPYPNLKGGDFVRIRTGALTGIQGILIRVKNQYRVVLSVEALQKAVAVEVDISSVELVNSPSGIVPPALAQLGRTA
jgi:transcription antitermination factor NusG